MSGDRSLDEFATGDTERTASEEIDSDVDVDLGADSDVDADADAGSDSDSDVDVDADAGADSDSDPDIDPAESTYAWSPSGTACASCGATVERRWRDEGDLVCADCKSW